MVKPVPPVSEEMRARKRRNLWLGLALGGFVVLVGLTTAIRLADANEGNVSFYYNTDDSRQADGAKPELPPGMTPDQAAPPPNLAAEPPASEPEEAAPQ